MTTSDVPSHPVPPPSRLHPVPFGRKGRQVTVKVISEDYEGGKKVDEVQSVLPGSKSVFNVDQRHSVLHVGGFPTSAKVQVSDNLGVRPRGGGLIPAKASARCIGNC